MASSRTFIFPIFCVASCCYAGLAYAIVSVQFDSTNVPESPREVVPSFHEVTENLATSLFARCGVTLYGVVCVLYQ